MDKNKIISNAKEKYNYLEYYFDESHKNLKKIYFKYFLEKFEELEAIYLILIRYDVKDEIINDYRHLYNYVRSLFNQKEITKKMIEFYDGKRK